MLIGIVYEPEDERVALGPDVVRMFIESDNEVIIEKGAGESAFFDDEVYTSVGAELASSSKEVLGTADILITLDPLPESKWSMIKDGAIWVSLFQPYVDPGIQSRLLEYGITSFSLDMIPRTTIAQTMDVLSSMGSIAGYKAVLEAAERIPRYFPMLSTAAGTVAPARVLVLGAGVAGLQAIATAKRLGAIVEAFDTRAAAKEEVESLGAKFVEVDGATDDASAGGYGVEQSDDYKNRQKEKISERIAQADAVITTALVRGPKAPVLITREMVESMRPGSVIIDLAAATGGNCELTRDKETVMHQGVTIVGDSNLAAKVSLNATQLFGRNVFNFLSLMLKDGSFEPDWENLIIKESCISRPQLTSA